MSKNFGKVICMPVFILALLFSRHIPYTLLLVLFFASFGVFLLGRKYYQRYPGLFTINFVILIFSSLYFFGWCTLLLIGLGKYDSITALHNAEGMSWVICFPVTIIFAFIVAMFFDKWRDKSRGENNGKS